VRRPRDHVAATGLTRYLDLQANGGVPAVFGPHLDPSAMHRHVIDIHLDAWLGHQDEPPAPDLRLDLQCRAGDDRVGEVELHGPADRAYLHPLRDHPPAAPRGIPALIVKPDDLLSPRGAPAHMAGHLGKVSRQRRQFAARARRQGRVQALVKLARGQPPVTSGNPEDLDHPVPVFIGGPQLRLSASTRTSCRWEIIARHGHILQDIARARNLDRIQRLRVRDIMISVNNIVLPTSGSCPFCAFLRGEKPYTILRRSELVAILVTREQRGVSHLLVVPVRHCPTILDLRDEESGALMSEIRQAARIVDAAERRPGIAVWQNNGITANQAVAHVHFHVAGTLEGGGTMWGEVPKLSVAETDAIAERLRQVEASLRH
jgi:histidine triad (HIT) family protein